MNTKQQFKPRTTEHDHEPQAEPPKVNRLELSATKILGGALAAMTAAALGSRLSVAGTVVGAAIASIIAAIAGSLYTASLQHTREKVRTVWTGRTGADDVPTAIEVVRDELPPTSAWAPAQPSAPDAAVQPAATEAAWMQHSSAQAPQTGEKGWPPHPARRRANWSSILVGALAAFAIAGATLTGFELISGHALSGGDGTTIQQVSEATGESSPPKQQESTKPSASPTEQPSSEPSPTSEPSLTTTPEPEASSTPEPTTEPSDTPSATTPAPPASVPGNGAGG